MQITLTHLSHRPTIDIPPRVFKNHHQLPVLGRGGFGTVYKFTHARKKYDVALKHIYTVDSKDISKKLMTLRQEIFLHSQLLHRNIAAFLGQYEGDEGLFIVLEYVDGTSLYNYIELNYQQRTPDDAGYPVLPYDYIFRYTRYILKGLEYLHRKRIVHSDLRCANVLLTSTHVAKLADFGISTQLGSIAELSGFKRPGAILKVGNPLWCAPEVLKKGEADYSSDVWSFGICLMEMIFFQLPFGIGGYDAIAQYYWKLCKEQAMPEVPDWVEDDLKNLVMECIVYDPIERYRPRELLEILDSIEMYEDDDDGDEDDEEDGEEYDDNGGGIAVANAAFGEVEEDLWSIEQINHVWNEKVKRIRKKLLRRTIKHLPLQKIINALDDSYGLASLYLAQALDFNTSEMDQIRYYPTQHIHKAGYLLHKLKIEDLTVNELQTALQHVCNEEAVRTLNEVQEQRLSRNDVCDKLSDLTVGELMRLSEPLCCVQRPECDWRAVAVHLDKEYLIKEIEAPRNPGTCEDLSGQGYNGPRGGAWSGARAFIDILNIKFPTIVCLRDEVRDACEEKHLGQFPEILHVVEAFHQSFDAKMKVKLSNCQQPDALKFAFLTQRTNSLHLN